MANECEERTREVMIDAPIKYNRTPGRFLGNDTESEAFFSNSISYMIHYIADAFAGKICLAFGAHYESVSSLSNEYGFFLLHSQFSIYEKRAKKNL